MSFVQIAVILASLSGMSYFSFFGTKASRIKHAQEDEKANKQETTSSDLLQLEERLSKVMVEQETAVKAVCYELIRQSTIWSSKSPKPPVFLFCGKSGAGKLFLAKQIGIALNMHLALFDMSSYTTKSKVEELLTLQKHDDSSLKEGALNAEIAQHPKGCVVVFQQVELAHNLLFSHLNILLEQGVLWKKKHFTDDEQEAFIDCRNCIFIFITSLPDKYLQELLQSSSMPNFQEAKKQLPTYDVLDYMTNLKAKLMPVLRKHLSTKYVKDGPESDTAVFELLKRMNAIIPFFPISNQQLYHSIVLELDKYAQVGKSSDRNIKLHYESDLVLWLMKKYEAKSLTSVKEMIENHVATALAIADAQIGIDDTVALFIGKQNRICLKITNEDRKRHYYITSKL